MQLLSIHWPETIKYPIVINLPHSGTFMPDSILADIQPELMPPDDTDWHLELLYDFANTTGMVLIQAHYSRWVIDLNRNADASPLYNDGRLITHLCPVTNFTGTAIYKDERKLVAATEVELRKADFYTPYHNTLQKVLNDVKSKFGKVLLWDGHSIRREVPTISKMPFPDFILGSADGQSAPENLVNTTLNTFSNNGFDIRHNFLFKGGYITRHFGRPSENQYTLQLEMSKDLYLTDNEMNYNALHAAKVKNTISNVITELGEVLLDL